MNRVALAAAGASLGVYVVAAVWLAWQRSAGEPDWTRAVYVVTGIEAVAFAAAGWLWGTQVGRGAAEAADRRADDAMRLLADRDEVISDQRAAVVDAHAARAAAEAGMDAAMRAVEAFSRGMDGSADAERLRLLVWSLRPGAFAPQGRRAEPATRVTTAPLPGRDTDDR